MIWNAKIIRTMLGYEEGMLTCFIIAKGENHSGGVSGYTLDVPSKNSANRSDSWAAGFWIRRILEVTGVETWENLIGTYIRVDSEPLKNVKGIGHITAEKWFYPAEELESICLKLNKKGEENEFSRT